MVKATMAKTARMEITTHTLYILLFLFLPELIRLF